MSLIEDMFKGGSLGTGLAVGLGAVVLLPVVTRIARPAAKAVIKGGITMYRQSGIAEATGDLIAEARAEIDQESRAAGDGAATERSGRRGPGTKTDVPALT
jgi:hypothetical protein